MIIGEIMIIGSQPIQVSSFLGTAYFSLDMHYFKSRYQNEAEALYIAGIYGVACGIDSLIDQGRSALNESLKLGYSDAKYLLDKLSRLDNKVTSDCEKQEIISYFKSINPFKFEPE